jgi:hypothetical protein
MVGDVVEKSLRRMKDMYWEEVSAAWFSWKMFQKSQATVEGGVVGI